MKKIFLKAVYILSIALMFTGCSLGGLDLQDSFDFESDVNTTDPFAEMTAWEFIQLKDSIYDEDGVLDSEGFDYLEAAIKVADFEDQFDQDTTENRTYLLLDNSAFIGSGDVINVITGSSIIAEGETPDQVMARADTAKLKEILRYHIVTTKILQVPTLYNYGVYYTFQTLIDGEDGIICFSRDEKYNITVNASGSPMPSSATSQYEKVHSHNYVFSNGVGHILADMVRNQPY